MSFSLNKAGSSDIFAAKLDTIKSGIENGKYVDERLSVYTKFTACFCIRWLLQPLFALSKADAFAPFRVKTVANSIFEYCKANKDYLTDVNLQQKAIKVITVLAQKVKDPDKNTAVLGVIP